MGGTLAKIYNWSPGAGGLSRKDGGAVVQGLLIVPRNSSGKLSTALPDYPYPGGLGDESPNVAPVPEN